MLLYIIKINFFLKWRKYEQIFHEFLILFFEKSFISIECKNITIIYVCHVIFKKLQKPIKERERKNLHDICSYTDECQLKTNLEYEELIIWVFNCYSFCS